MFTYSDVFKDKKNILIVTAHPDDCLVYFAALIAKLRQEDKNVFALVVTNGARGSKNSVISEQALAEQRIEEEVVALEFLKVNRENFVCLDYKDGEVESDMNLIGEISKYIRKFKVDIVCTHEPTVLYDAEYGFVQHRDHRKVGEAVIDAVYPFSRDRSFFTEHLEEGIEPHSVYEILLTPETISNLALDYTDELETKKSAMRLHKSQFDENFINQVVDDYKEGERYFEKYKYVKLQW